MVDYPTPADYKQECNTNYNDEEPHFCRGCHEEIEDWDEAQERNWRGECYLFCCYDCAEDTPIDWMDEERSMDYDPQDSYNLCDFRDPGGRSALRNGPRIYPCPNCGEPNMLTPADKAHGYQCDACADQLERGW
jgi:hypothetical protein